MSELPRSQLVRSIGISRVSRLNISSTIVLAYSSGDTPRSSSNLLAFCSSEECLEVLLFWLNLAKLNSDTLPVSTNPTMAEQIASTFSLLGCR